jgi:regulator of replication initiation timing
MKPLENKFVTIGLLVIIAILLFLWGNGRMKSNSAISLNEQQIETLQEEVEQFRTESGNLAAKSNALELENTSLIESNILQGTRFAELNDAYRRARQTLRKQREEIQSLVVYTEKGEVTFESDDITVEFPDFDNLRDGAGDILNVVSEDGEPQAVLVSGEETPVFPTYSWEDENEWYSLDVRVSNEFGEATVEFDNRTEFSHVEEKAGLFSNRSTYTVTATSLNPYVTESGVTSYRLSSTDKRLGLGLNAGYVATIIDGEVRLVPAVGAGIQFNAVEFK